MRTALLLATTSLLAACGGGGVETISGTAAPPANNIGGAGNDEVHSFVNPTEQRTYTGIGSMHSYEYNNSTEYDFGEYINNNALVVTPDGQDGQLYQGNASTVRDSGISITFNPRDGIFDVTFADGLAGINETKRFQDPLHRTDFGGALEPQGGVPQFNAAGMNYLEAGTGDNVFFPNAGQNIGGRTITGNTSDIAPTLAPDENTGSYNVLTYFYQTPGTDTQYVTFAGFLRNQAALSRVAYADEDIVYQLDPVTGERVEDANGNPIALSPTSYVNNQYDFERGAFVFGEQSFNNAVPTSGTASFTGTSIASLVFNNIADNTGDASSFFQWMEGSASATVNFGANTFALDLSGTVFAPEFDLSTNRAAFLPGGTTFSASGDGTIDLVRTGGFKGEFNQAWFVTPGGQQLDLNLAGSSVDGAFYGPNAEEIGGGYRIVGGTPDERIDILGSFVGAQD